MQKELIAGLLVLLMVAGLASYVISNGEAPTEEPLVDDQPSDTSRDEWGVYAAADDGELPACDGDAVGRLYFLNSTSSYMACTDEGWGKVNLEGDLTPPDFDANSTENTPMLATATTPTLEACSSGGTIISQGIDDDENGVLESAEIDYTTTSCSNFVITQVTDINLGSSSGNADDIVVMGTRLYFEAYNGDSGWELWTHETTNGTTWQAAEIREGSDSGYANDIAVMGTRLYFESYHDDTGWELWTHESTNGSTWQAADINPGDTNSYANDITIMGTRLYFEA